jgi:hypothetical protein
MCTVMTAPADPSVLPGGPRVDQWPAWRAMRPIRPGHRAARQPAAVVGAA